MRTNTSTGTLPSGWNIFDLERLVDVLDSKRKPVNSRERLERTGAVPYFGAAGQVGSIDKALFDEDLILLGEDGVQFFDANTHKAYEISGPSWVNNHAHVLRCKKEMYVQRLLVHFLNQFDYRGFANGTTRLKLTQGAMNRIPVLVPPLSEQEKIVEILEEQLSRLDAALASVCAVREKAARFRRSLLHAAFTGALTGRVISNGNLLSGWKICELQDVAKWGSGGTPKSGNRNFYGGDIPWAVIGDLTESLVTKTAQCITKQGLENSSAKVVKPGTVLLAMYGASIGRTGVAAVEMATNQAIAFAVPFDEMTNSSYLLKFLQSQKEAFVRAGQGGAQPNISQTVIKPWPIPIPPLKEQEKIVEVLEEQFSRLDAALALVRGVREKVVDEIESRVAALRRSLLHAAFTGNLTKEWRENNYV